MPTHPLTAKEDRPRIRWGRLAIMAIGFFGLYVVGRFVADMVAQQFGLVMHVRSEPTMHTLIMTASAIYFVLMAIPFMPGMEIGLSMILVLGSKIVFLVYICTFLALIPPYLIGRLIPAQYCARAFKFLGLERLGRLMDQMAPLSAEQRLAFLLDNTPSRITPFLLRHRFVALAAVLNIPGNILIGGGGGIAMLAGVTGLYPLPAYLLTIALAVAPVPLIIMVSDVGFLG